MQAQFISLNTIVDGKSNCYRNYFENRFMHVQELIRMGGDFLLQEIQQQQVVRILPYSDLNMATDLRASASLIISRFSSRKGQTKIDRIYYIDREYERIEEKLIFIDKYRESFLKCVSGNSKRKIA